MKRQHLSVIRHVAAAVVVAACTGVLIVWACGPFFTDYDTVVMSAPADRRSFDAGSLGVVKPMFARRYLIQAYRTLNGAPHVSLEAVQPPPAADPDEAVQRWLDARDGVVSTWQPPGTARPAINPTRWLETFETFDNCLVDSFDRAVLTLGDRVQRYGAQSRQVRDWVAAQDAVFANCGGKDFVVPPEPSADAEPLERADRMYQSASALFYAMRYDEAARAFRAIAEDASSPWHGYGRYLAARASLRAATVTDTDATAIAAHLDAAAAGFRLVAADANAAPLHESAAGLADLIASRRDPLARLATLSRRLATSATVTSSDVVNYTRLMDLVLDSAPDAPGSLHREPQQLLQTDDMTAWIVALQRGDPFAVERWAQTRSETWLAAALWAVDPSDTRSAALLDAAARLAPTSPAFPMASFLRVRLLLNRGDLEGARRVLAVLPSSPGSGIDPETVNLLDAARLATASSLETLLAAAPRRIVSLSTDGSSTTPDAGQTFTAAVWDDDVATVMNARLPLDVLVNAAESTILPGRLRSRVAQQAFTRSIVLGRYQEGRRAAAVLRDLAPPVRADLDRYLAANTDAERQRAGVITLLRTPGLSIDLLGVDTDVTYTADEPGRRLGHAFARNWWCEPSDGRAVGAGALLFGEGVERPFPPFLSPEQREATTAELDALRRAGDGRTFLITHALAWADASPADPDVAEALARAIEGWRWSPCTFGQKSPLPQRAFATLHRRYPRSEWARRTPYWYE
jgi:hypothetical protein